MKNLIRYLMPFLMAFSIFAQSTPTIQVDTWAALKSITIPPVPSKLTALVKGRLSTNDGGGGVFFFTPGAGATEDGGTIATPNVGTGAWFRQYSGALNIRWFGATGGNVTDDTVAIQTAINLALTNQPMLKSVYMPAGSYKYGNLVIKDTVNNALRIYGDGLLETLLIPTVSDGSASILVDGVDYVTMSDFGIKGANTPPSTNTSVGIYFKNSNRYAVNNIYVQGMGIGVAFDNTTANIAVNNNIWCRYCGLGLKANGFNACTLTYRNENNTDGFLIKQANGIVLNNPLTESQSSGGGRLKNVNFSTINAPYFEGNGGYHMKIGQVEGGEAVADVQCNGLVINGGSFSDSANTSIIIDHVNNLRWFGGNFPLNGVNNINVPSVQITSNATDIKIENANSIGNYFTEDGARIKPALNLAPDSEFYFFTNTYGAVTLGSATISKETSNTRTLGHAIRASATAGANNNFVEINVPAYVLTALLGSTAFISAWVYVPAVANFTNAVMFPTWGSRTDAGAVMSSGLDVTAGKWNYMNLNCVVATNTTFLAIRLSVNGTATLASGNEYLIMDSLFVGFSPQNTNQVRNGFYATDWGVVNGGTITNGVTGSGTVNTMAKFTGASAVGNSSITDDATTVKLNGTVEQIQATNAASILNLKSETPTDLPVLIDTYSSTVVPGIAGRRARGTIASPTAVQTDDVLAQLGGRGYGATAFSTTSRGRVRAVAGQVWTDANQGAYLSFDTTPNGGTTTSETFRMTDTYWLPAVNRAVQMGSSTNKIGGLSIGPLNASSNSLSWYDSSDVIQGVIGPAGGVTIGGQAPPGAGNLTVNGITTLGNATAITASAPNLNIIQNWNSGGVTFNSTLWNITSTASAAASTFWDAQISGSSKASLRKDGFITSFGGFGLGGTTMQLTTATSDVTLANGNSGRTLTLQSDKVKVSGSSASAAVLQFSGTATGLSYIADGVLGFGTGASGSVAGWSQWGGESRNSAQFDKTTDTTLANVTGLTATLIAGRTYNFRVHVDATLDTTGGGKYAMGGTCTATAINFRVRHDAASLTRISSARQTSLGSSVNATSTLTDDDIEIEGQITVNAAGSLTVQFAQAASNGTSSILSGGSMLVWDTP